MPVDIEALSGAYEDVRNDNTETSWAFLAYDGNDIIVESTGSDYAEFKTKFTDDLRAFGFVRMITGDEMSRRAKFALLTWCGNNVSALKRAKMSTDKSEVKRVIQSVACELQVSELDELEEAFVKEQIIRAGGANYGTGQ